MWFCLVENLALLRHTTAKHALSSAISSDRIVDGKRTKLYYGGGECFYTQNGHAFAVWYVDLAYLRGMSESLYTTGQTMLNGVCILF